MLRKLSVLASLTRQSIASALWRLFDEKYFCPNNFCCAQSQPAT